MIWKRTVTGDIVTYGRYGRAVALVSLGGFSIYAEMVRSGFASTYIACQTDARLNALQNDARANKRGR